MASTIVKSTGSAGSVVFGTTITFSALIVESQTHTKNTETTTIADADGDVVSAAFYGATESLSISGSTNGTPSVTLGASISLTGAPTGTFYPTSYEESHSNNGYKKFSLNCTRWSGTES